MSRPDALPRPVPAAPARSSWFDRSSTAPSPTLAWLRRLRPVDQPWLRLVCLPHAGGTASFFRPWCAALPNGIELYAVQYPGRLDRFGEACVDDMDTMAEHVSTAVRPLLAYPVALFGHSLGAAIAYEVARRLAAGEAAAPVRLFVSGRPAPDRPRPGVLHLASDSVLWNELGRLNGTRPEVLADAALREMFLPALRSDYRLVESYVPQPGPALGCPISVLFGDHDDEIDAERAHAWSAFTVADFSVREFPGDHFYLVGCLPDLIGEIIARLADSGARPGPREENRR